MSRYIILFITILSVSIFSINPVFAQSGAEGPNDPFSDFSEFEEGADEEKDINFFKNGRFINVGTLVGQRGYTSTMAKVFGPQVSFGFFLAYFFDLRFALQFSYLTGQGEVKASSENNVEKLDGNADLETFQIDFKYYFNTQNVTKGLADLNPYLLLGYSQVTQSISTTQSLEKGLDSAHGLNAGAGIEIPFLKNQMFFGLQMTYHLVNFPAEGGEFRVADLPTGISLKGDIYSIMGIVGANF